MRFSIWPGLNQPWADVATVAAHADATGWHRVYVADHFMPNAEAPADGPTHECWAAMAALAATTTNVGLGTLVCGNTYRHPAVLAKTAVTVDHVSGGRVALGLGAGWQVNEHAAYGIELPSVKDRLDRFAEACAVVKGLLTETRTTFAGAHYTVTDAPLDPKPVGPLPLLVGGGGEKRTLRIVADHADEWNVWGLPDTVAAKAAVLAGHCAAVGRDPATITRSTQALVWWGKEPRPGGPGFNIAGTPEQILDVMGAYAAAGIDEFILPAFNLGGPDRTIETMELFREHLVPALA